MEMLFCCLIKMDCSACADIYLERFIFFMLKKFITAE